MNNDRLRCIQLIIIIAVACLLPLKTYGRRCGPAALSPYTEQPGLGRIKGLLDKGVYVVLHQ